MADYAKSNWINTTADIYTQSESNFVNSTSAEPDVLTEEQVLASKMSGSFSTQDAKLKQKPLPSEDEIETMLTEIRQLEQQEIQTAVEFSDENSKKGNGPLKQVLSAIPSFSEMNK